MSHHKSPANSPAAPPPDDEDLPFIDSPPLISAAPPSTATPSPLNNFDEDSDFEFEFSLGDQETRPAIAADEIFSDGRIRPVYPVFNRGLLLEEKTCRQPLLQLLIEDRGPSTSSGNDDLEGIPPASYCVWRPGEPQPPEIVRKSSSTGSSRRRRIRDFVVGRSQSDGKEKFMFFAAEERSSAAKGGVAANEEKRKGKGKEKKKATELDLVTAHRMFYGKGGNGMAAGGGSAAGGRKSYLPYKPEIVGFFARVNGIGRSHHPF